MSKSLSIQLLAARAFEQVLIILTRSKCSQRRSMLLIKNSLVITIFFHHQPNKNHVYVLQRSAKSLGKEKNRINIYVLRPQSKVHMCEDVKKHAVL